MTPPIETYLTDHLAGADAALDLLATLADEHEGELAGFFRDLHSEVAADRAQLEQLITDLGFERSRLRSAGARLAGKLTRPKLTGGDDRDGAFHRLEALDALQTGIEGKRALWLALSAAAEHDPRLARLDYAGLAERAAAQRERVNARRPEAARAALTLEHG